MANQVRTIDFLPEIFQTPVNRQFLNATLDQLVQEPKFKKTQGYVGRRVGPGVNATDRYVVEPTASRTNYQLEPGVVEIDPDNSSKILDTITYPGITDALKLQGGATNNADRLYTSEYYAFDPFVDFDKFTNFSQYYWLPAGPLAVDVSATAVPLTDDITVTRANGVYTFSGTAGTNPSLTLVRGGNYTFNVAQNAKETVNYRVQNSGTSSYLIDYQPNPTLTLVRGNTYVFTLNLDGIYPFYIKTIASLGNTNVYDTGVTNNGATVGTVTFTVPQDAPSTLYYSSSTEYNMRGQITIIDGTPGTGPGFWIQTDPGVNGVLPYAPNISSRDVLGVINNGEDLGTVTFNVPYKDAQSFYYSLNNIGNSSTASSVDLITTLNFDQINNQYVSSFLTTNGSIDGITNLNGRTLVFLNQNTDPESGGWVRTTQFDPLARDDAFNGEPGSFDTVLFDQATPVDPSVYYSVWQIQYQYDVDGAPYMVLSSVQAIDQLQKFSIGYGTQYSNTSWYKNAEGFFQEIPLLSAIKDILWYQDGTDPEIFGQIRLIDENQNATIFVESDAAPVTLYGAYINGNQLVITGSSGIIVPGMRLSGGGVTPETYILSGSGTNWILNHSATGTPTTAEIVEILGKKNYTAPNGVVFTNGLKVTFRGSVYPTSYANNTYYVEGVGTAIKLLPISNFITPETYTQSGTVPYDSTAFDVGNFDATLNAPIEQDYLTINRASPDLNAWTRSNRWFHVDVINYSAELNNITPTVDNLQRARRPILEFRAGTRLFDFGTDSIAPVDIIDFSATDALSNINGSTGYSIDGYTFIDGTTVIFAADTDSDVRNQVYQVQFITPDTVPPLIAEPIINLTPVYTTPIQYDQTVVVLSGQTQQGLSYWFDGVNWIAAQQKTKTNQAPLFNVYDADGISFSDKIKYPSTTFTGTKLFSYATPSTATETEIYSSLNDPVLGFQLVYLSLSNVGDIVFDNNLYKDTFLYALNSVGVTVPISNGFIREYSDRTTYDREIGWQTAVTKSRARQQFQFTYDGKPLLLDVKVIDSKLLPAIQLFVNATFQEIGTYTVQTTDNTTTITLLKTYDLGSVIEVEVLSDQVSKVGFYQVPVNLENNPLNANSEQFTLGTIRNHYGTICQNLINLSGPINGANNTRDLGDIVPYGQQILQQSSPLTLAGYFMRSKEYDIFAALNYNSREYIKFKSKLLDTAVNKEFGNMTVPEMLDSIIADITLGRTDLNPFYWSDMLPTGSVLQTTNTTVSAITTSVFNTIQTYDFTSSNYLGLLVYIYPVDAPDTPILLERGYDYEVSVDSPRLTITVPLNIGDVVSIAEYNNTTGNFVPNTPTKLGLYPKFKPEIFLDTNYVNPTYVIQGHDGSITVAFQDFRDEILLEFEKRIYNNLKTDDNPIPLTIDEVMPGFFRTTDYTQAEITNILGESFLSWVGWNKLDYKAQDYIASNPFTYNYSEAGSKLNTADQVTNVAEPPLLGAWRGIYRYFYDTESPNYTPWEMLGFSEEPTWWADRYGPAPYTSDNLVLWDDLANGYVADPLVPYIRPNYIRPNLQSVIPVGTEGQLLNPLESVVGVYDPTAFRKSWQVGDGGPVEYTWWTSSSYPYAVMRLLALTRPAEFFALFADRDDYRYNADLGQYLFNGRYRLDANGVPVYGNGQSRASYINWIVDYNQQLGLNSTDTLTTALANLDVRLCYRMAAFSDPQYLEIYTERSSPNSNNSSLLIPPESYNLVLYKNQPFADLSYSALIVERVVDGYAIFGYSTIAPYFQILASASNGVLQTINAGGTAVRVPAQYTDNIVQIPYGYTFTNTTMVVDFILSYGKYLETQGLIFDDQQNGYTLNWKQMAAEFLYFSQQGWSEGTMINLNPVATTLKAYRAGAVVDSIVSLTPENMLLDQNRGVLESRNLVIDREGNYFTITSTNNQTISFLQLRWTNYEHMVVLDNRSIFNDLLYDTVTGARQNRVRITAATTTDWTGEVNAQGFILNQNNVKQWQPYIKYAKGEIVKYKNQYWQAANIVQPKDKFDFNDWYKSNYDVIQQGLLPNIANKADQLSNSYNINSANLERDNDLLSYGLIGFRPREYMQALNLDDVTQVNLYSQFLGTKGTVLAAELFTRADLGKETGAYDIYENWAVLASTYGANANRSFYELRLNEADLQSNPATIQVIQPEQTSLADQTVYLNNIWRSSYKLSSTDILPTTYDTHQESALPSAGYVSLDDVDLTVFNINDPSSIEANIDSVGIGTTIWVAKVNSYDWNIYRCAEDPATMFQIQDNLNGTSIAYFTGTHNLNVGDLIIIRYFNQGVNGVYRVLAVPSISSITIAFSFANVGQTSLTGNGLVFFLESKRVSQSSDIANLAYVKNLEPGSRVWVDNNGSGHWEVVEKQDVFTVVEALLPLESVSNSLYGTSTTQSGDHFAALVGSPNADTGTVESYRRDEFATYVPNLLLKLNATDVAKFGNWVDFGDKTWAAAAAVGSDSDNGYVLVLYFVPGSNDIVQTQLLIPPEAPGATPFEFGYQLSLSTNERWLYVGAPGVNKVYAYGRVDVETQEVVTISDGVTLEFAYSDNIQIDNAEPNQLRVFVNNLESIYGVDYLINADNVIFDVAPTAGQSVVISRRQAVQLDQNVYYSLFQDATSGSGQLAQFTVTNTRGTYYVSLVNPGNSYNNGDTITIDYTQICPAGSAANNLTITVTDVLTGGLINSFTTTGSGIDNTSVFALNQSLYTATNIDSFTVVVDGVYQRPTIDYTFDDVTTEITFITNPDPGAAISVFSDTYWQYTSSFTIAGLDADARFGASVNTALDGRQIVVGAPRDAVGSVAHAGSTYVIDRSSISYQITDTTQLSYALPAEYADPVIVSLNSQFLTNTNQFINGQFTVTGGNVVLSSLVPLTVGDTLTIETNLFSFLEKLNSDEPTDESAYGFSVKLCHADCSVYSGAPFDTVTLPQDGAVYRGVNQSRVYGVTTSTNANPTLTPGDTIRINNFVVTVPTADIADLVTEINSSNIPNAIASLIPDLTFIGDGFTKTYSVGSIYSAAESYTTVVYVDDTLQTAGVDYTYNNTTQQINFVTAPASKSVITVVSGRMTVSVKNSQAAPATNKLTVLPGVSSSDTAFYDLGFLTYPFVQKITSPNPTDYAHFGYSVDIDTNNINLVVGAPNGNVIIPVIFDQGQTTFDAYSTTFNTPLINSGVVYTYNYLPAANETINNPGKFVFGQQVYVTNLNTGDSFGASVNYTANRLLVGAPGTDIGVAQGNYGAAIVYDNPTNLPAWTVIHAQEPTVDVGLLNGVYAYDKLLSKVTSYFDYINPLQGKILGAARRNIDYVGAVDPAQYNIGVVHNNGNSWASEHLGEIWWDTDTVRFIDPNQDDIVYASRRWGQLFPGSRVDIYQWTASTVPPVSYTGEGTPLSTVTYTVNTAVNTQGIVETTYYFWVRGINTIDTGAGKTLSPVNIASYIESPKTSGIPYLAPLNSSTVAIYNAIDLISAQDTILHIGFDRQAEGGDSNIHQEYQFVADGIADSFLNATLYRKLQDSFCGVNESGATVPDPTLSPAERYGVQFRPRQSMFSDRFKALQNYLTRANTILAQYPISEIRSFNLLNSSEPIPTVGSGQWNFVVANLEELGYQDLNIVPIGYRYLVLSDSGQEGRWTIYEVANGIAPGTRDLNLIRIQNYDTKLYWNYINWYAPGYNSSKQPLVQVPNYSSLNSVSLVDVPVGGSAKVVANAQGKFEIYLRTALGWTRVGLEDGTVAFKAELWNYTLGNFGFDAEIFDGQYFDQEPVIETRKIIQAINEELFIDELAIERNSSLILMFNFIYSEFTTPDWLIKTSLVDVNHKIRALLPYQMYMQDNQTFVLDYIQEVKPYHVQIREFNLIYSGEDTYGGNLTDFDVPAYWNSTLDVPQYISPILLPYDHATTLVQSDISDTASNAEIWLAEPWKQWFNNYLLSVQSVSIINPGSGYSSAPLVTVTGDCTTPAVFTTTINSAGQVVSINIVNPGAGYSVTPTITIDGSGNGETATAAALMGNELVRSIKTVIKYDRCEYTSTVVDWQANVSYTNGTLVRYADRVWSAIGTVDTSVFITTDWTEVDAGSLSGADRTMGYYLPAANEPGLSLPLLIDGIDYPGVQVTGPLYNQNTGFDVGNFDINPFDNISLDANGLPTYDYGILDTFYASFYGTPATGPIPTGTAITDINVAGGGYVDTYSSHAPEELIPGAEFDTLDMRIYTTPGADWELNGHGFPEGDQNYEFDPLNPTLSFVSGVDAIPTPVSLSVTNVTQTHELVFGVDYTVNWVDQTITIINGANSGDIIQISTYGVGGGNQLFKQLYNGANVGNSLIIPIQYALIQELAIFVNGVYLPEQLNDSTENYTYAIEDSASTIISFNSTYTSTDAVVVVAIGPTTIDSTTVDYSWSAPQTQIIAGVTGQLIYTLTNSLEYSNPDNMVVTINGVRARTSAGAEYYADGSTGYLLPQRLGFSQAVIADTDVRVYINDIPQQLNVDFVVEPYDPLDPARGIIFTTPPTLGERILVCVNTNAQCIIVNSNQIQFNAVGGLVPNNGDTITVTTFNDTRQQNILTQVFVGPTTTGITVTEAYDETDFDIGTVTGASGSYDYTAGVVVTVNDLMLEHVITDPTRIYVTLNGNRLTYGFGFDIVDNEIILNQILGPTDVVMITEFTESLVPESMAFRIFQDMRGIQAIYRITPNTTTTLVEPLLSTDDIIYVDNASVLGQPDLNLNIWGVITINGERIMYRECDTVNNTVSSLLRGTAGTAAADHNAGASVYDTGRGNLLPIEYQNYIVSNIDTDTRDYPLGDGSTTTFAATAINLGTAEDSTNLDLAVEVYVGGTLQTGNYTIISEDPVVVDFDTAPAAGSAVTILVRRGVDWYNPGAGTPSNGVALQDTNNKIARFLRGL